MPGRGTIHVTFIPKQILEKYEVAGKKLFVVFANLEKALNRTPKEVSWLVSRRIGIIEREGH